MDVIENTRNFNYNMSKLLGIDKPTPPPEPSEVIMTISGLTGAHKWCGLGNGTHYIDVNEKTASSTDHSFSYKNPNITDDDSRYGYFYVEASLSTGSHWTVYIRRSYAYMTAVSESKKNFAKCGSYKKTSTSPMPTYISALRDDCWNKTLSFTHMGDPVTVVLSKGSLWSKGNM